MQNTSRLKRASKGLQVIWLYLLPLELCAPYGFTCFFEGFFDITSSMIPLQCLAGCLLLLPAQVCCEQRSALIGVDVTTPKTFAKSGVRC